MKQFHQRFGDNCESPTDKGRQELKGRLAEQLLAQLVSETERDGRIRRQFEESRREALVQGTIPLFRNSLGKTVHHGRVEGRLSGEGSRHVLDARLDNVEGVGHGVGYERGKHGGDEHEQLAILVREHLGEPLVKLLLRLRVAAQHRGRQQSGTAKANIHTQPNPTSRGQTPQ